MLCVMPFFPTVISRAFSKPLFFADITMNVVEMLQSQFQVSSYFVSLILLTQSLMSAMVVILKIVPIFLVNTFNSRLQLRSSRQPRKNTASKFTQKKFNMKKDLALENVI